MSRYIHLNPVHVGAARGLEEKDRIAALLMYRWSSYPEYAGLRESESFVDEEPILRMMGEGKVREGYRKHVEAGITETDDESRELLKKAAWGIDGESFAVPGLVVDGQGTVWFDDLRFWEAENPGENVSPVNTVDR